MLKDKVLHIDGDGPAIRRDGIHVPVRWIVATTGSAGLDDPQTTFSYGESRELVEEVTDVCRAFHPGALMHTFPKEYPVYLFWRAESTGDWIVAHVTATSHQRNSLSYWCLVFDDFSFHALRYNPFRVRNLNLHDRLRTHLQENRIDPFRCTIPRSAVPGYQPADDLASDPVAQTIPGISADCVPNEANLRAIQEYCSRWTERPAPPPSFATWWCGENEIPTHRFSVVLSRTAPRILNIDEARNSVSAVSYLVKDILSRTATSDDLITADFVQLMLQNAGSAENAIARAAAFSDTDVHSRMQYRLQNDIAEVKLNLGQIRSRLCSLVDHLEDRLTFADMSEYARISEQILELEYSLHTNLNPEPPAAASRAAGWPFKSNNRHKSQHSGNRTSPAKPTRFAPWEAVQGIFLH